MRCDGWSQRRLSPVVFADPPLLILGEATSTVGAETELAIQASIEELAADRTTLAIAHRLSTVTDADEILVVEDGEIAGRGDHDDLLVEDGRYAALWSVQASVVDFERRAEVLPED